MPNSRPDNPIIDADVLIAHRGWQNCYPENTLPAIKAAINAGARHIEIDIQLSRDGVPILLHNRTLDHMANYSGAAHELTLDELQQLNAGEASRFGDRFTHLRLCTLADVVSLITPHPDIHLYVELKRVAIEHHGEARVVENVLQTIEPVATQCTLISFWLPALAIAQQQGFARLGPVLIEWQQLDNHELIALSPSVIFCDSEKIPANLNLATLPWPFAIYEIDESETARYWLNRGARWIETFRIGELLSEHSLSTQENS